MAIKTQAELQQASNATYTTNGANAITAATVRTFNTDFISSSIVAPMTSSMAVGTSISASYAATASVLLGSVVSASFANNANTATSASYALTASFAANVPATASYALNALSASRAVSAASADTAISASYALTASFASNVPATASYALFALSASNALTASSVNTLIQPVVITGSLDISASSSTAITANRSVRLTGSVSFTVSRAGNSSALASQALTFNSASGNINGYYANQYLGFQKQTGSILNEFYITNDAVASFAAGWTGSAIAVTDPSQNVISVIGFQNAETWTDGRVTVLKPLVISGSTISTGGFTGSLQGTATTASYVLNAVSASYALTSSHAQSANNFTASNILVNGTITAASASFTYLNTIYETSSVVYSSGSNVFGDASNDVQTLYGTVDIKTGPLLVTGSAEVSGALFVNNNVLQVTGEGVAPGTYYGPNALTQLVGTDAAAIDIFINNGGDSLHVETIGGTGTVFQDLNGQTFGNETWLTIPSNGGGTNPAPQFTRGLGITGSLDLTGSVSFNGSSVVINAPFTANNTTEFNAFNNFKNNTLMQSPDTFPLHVSGTLQTERIHFRGNPFNGNPGSNLGAIRFEGQNQTFYSTNYDLGNITTQSRVEQTVITASNFVETALKSDNFGQNYYLKLTNQTGTGSLTTNANTVISGSLAVSQSILVDQVNMVRAGFNSNPFNHQPSSYLASMRYGTNNQDFTITNYNQGTTAEAFTSQSIVGLFLNTGSNYVNTYLRANYAGVSGTLDLSNANGNLNLNTNARFTVSASNTMFQAPGGTGVGTWFQNRVLISGPSTGETPTLWVSGSDGAYTQIGRASNNINTTIATGIDAAGQIYANDTRTAGQYIGVYTPDTFVDDVEHAIIVSNTGVTLNDWDNGSAFDYVPYMTIAPNLGDNPTPQMKRGLGVTGSLAIQSGSGDLYVYGHKQFNGGMFQNNTTLSGSAGVSQSIALPITDLSYGVSISDNSRITIANAGVYNLQFSAQCESSAGADTIYIWFKKNGTNVTDSATKVVMPNNTAQTMTVNILVNAAANDYYELAWQNSNGFGKILSEAASGNIPLIPAVIVTVTQVR